MNWVFIEQINLASVIDHFAVAVFAFSGALVASRKQMDVIGFILLGTVTGVGGGTVRDILLGQTPLSWVHDPSYIIVCIVAACITFFAAHLLNSRYRLLLWLDALGVSLFCVLGAEHALDADAHPVVAVIMGMITATFGGIIRDVLGGEVSLLLKREIYVTAALAGAVVFVGLSTISGDRMVNVGAGFMCCFIFRGLALHFGWSIPGYKARPGRDIY